MITTLTIVEVLLYEGDTVLLLVIFRLLRSRHHVTKLTEWEIIFKWQLASYKLDFFNTQTSSFARILPCLRELTRVHVASYKVLMKKHARGDTVERPAALTNRHSITLTIPFNWARQNIAVDPLCPDGCSKSCISFVNSVKSKWFSTFLHLPLSEKQLWQFLACVARQKERTTAEGENKMLHLFSCFFPRKKNNISLLHSQEREREKKIHYQSTSE